MYNWVYCRQYLRTKGGVNLISRTKRKKIIYIYIYIKIYSMFDQETGYLLGKRGGVNYTKRSSPVKRWMNNYMGLIQIEKERVRVDYRVTIST